MRAYSPTSVDEYLAQVESNEARKSLTNLRAVIRAAAPQAEEVISYGIPTFKYHGMICSYAAFKSHCSFFPGHTASEFAEELKGYKTSKGTVHFQPSNPLPDSLVTAMVQSRLSENIAKAKQ